MENNKLILSYCPNFERIMSTDFLAEDTLSLELVRIYKKYIFQVDINNFDDIANVKELDYIMGKYVEDYLFRKKFQEQMHNIRIKKNAVNIIKAIVESLIQMFKNYELETTRKIDISRWI